MIERMKWDVLISILRLLVIALRFSTHMPHELETINKTIDRLEAMTR